MVPVPLIQMTWEANSRFTEADPWDGHFWADSGAGWTAWDELHRGSWIRLAHAPQDGVWGGLPLRQYQDEGTYKGGVMQWDEEQAFVPSVLHQLHCTVGAKSVPTSFPFPMKQS